MQLRRRDHEETLGPGATVGPYRIEATLGEGGMGSVYRAIRLDDGSVVALKVVKSKLAADKSYARRFAHEARAASRVRHKHLIPLLDFGEADGRPYLAMRYVSGRSLEQRIDEEGPLPVADVVRVAAQIGSALDALHAQGVVHRDVKAANIMLEQNGSASLTDFGLAKGRGFSTLTRPGQIVGTIDYLAPERIRGEQASAMTDIYALGCVVYEAIAGRPPFAGKSVLEVGMAILEDDPPDPCAGRGDVPLEFSRVVGLALAKDPDARPKTGILYANLLTFASRST